jgi:hypothetical protein
MAHVQHSQTNPPARTRHQQDHKNFHYVNCQNDADNIQYVSAQYDLLDRSSLVDPDKPMYEVVSTSARDTGSSNMTLLRCSMEDHKADMKRLDDKAYRLENAVSGLQKHKDGLAEASEETFVRGTALAS